MPFLSFIQMLFSSNLNFNFASLCVCICVYMRFYVCMRATLLFCLFVFIGFIYLFLAQPKTQTIFNYTYPNTLHHTEFHWFTSFLSQAAWVLLFYENKCHPNLKSREYTARTFYRLASTLFLIFFFTCVIYLFYLFIYFIFILVRCSTSYIQAQCTRLHHKLTRAILHISSLAAYNIKHIFYFYFILFRI